MISMRNPYGISLKNLPNFKNNISEIYNENN